MTTEDHPGQAPLIRIAAPPGTGKSAVLPHLVARAHGAAVVADIDEILEQGHLLGVPIADPAAAEAWPAYDRLWDRITGLVTRTGIPMVLLTQVPDADVDAVAGELLLGWEIGDAQRAARLRARGESDDVIDDARHDAEVLRALLPPARIHRGGRDDAVSQAADQLWRFVTAHW